jgi:hypothetical protein
MGQQLRLIETFGLSDNVAKARDKFGAINLNHSVSKKWTHLVLRYSSTFNQSITNSERGIFEPTTTNIATLENRKTKQILKQCMQNLVLSTKPMITNGL